MQIDDSKRPRSALKTYFAKNAIPTEDQFAQAIDSGLNQRDDGVVKTAGDALSIEAAGDDTQVKRAIDFYVSFADADPAWSIALKPRANPADPSTGRLGWSVLDGSGNAQLTIDGATGNVGIGTVQPGEKLEVAGRIRAGTTAIGPWPANAANYAFFGASTLDQTQQGNYALLQSSGSLADRGTTYLNSPTQIVLRLNNNTDRLIIGNTGTDVYGPLRAQSTLTPSVGNSEANGILFPPDPAGGSGDRAWMRYYSRGGESMTLEVGCSNDGDDHIALMPSGNVGIGTNSPSAKLEIIGNLIVHGNIQYGHNGTITQLPPDLFIPIGGIGGVFGGGNVFNPSSAELKKDIHPIASNEAAAIVNGLEPVSFRWKEGDQRTQLGFIAEDSPDAVTTAQHDGIFMNHITAALTRVVRDLTATVAGLQQRLAALETAAA